MDWEGAGAAAGAPTGPGPRAQLGSESCVGKGLWLSDQGSALPPQINPTCLLITDLSNAQEPWVTDGDEAPCWGHSLLRPRAQEAWGWQPPLVTKVFFWQVQG